jgi:hypothetical protein
MFKSILPSRKVPDGDFFMVTPPADSLKENYPALGTASTNHAPKAKTEKRKKSKDQETPPDVAVTEQAFDQLLVRPDLLLLADACSDKRRMSSRSRLLCDQSLRGWSPPLRRL